MNSPKTSQDIIELAFVSQLEQFSGIAENACTKLQLKCWFPIYAAVLQPESLGARVSGQFGGIAGGPRAPNMAGK